MSPICYHKMCESCVDRIFTQGPAPCPVIACGKTLRKNKFRKQTFEDVTVEREVDVRKRVAKTFNKRRDDFSSLREYNDYLEEVEDMTFNLVNGAHVAATEAKLSAYEAANRELITTNAARAAAEMQAAAAASRQELDAARVAREFAAREAEEERREAEELKKRTLDALASGSRDAAKVIAEVQLKQSGERKRRQAEAQMALRMLAEGRKEMLKSSLLAGRRGEVLDKVWDPLEGVTDQSEFYVVQEHYENGCVPPRFLCCLGGLDADFCRWLDNARKDVATQAGGYSVGEYCGRSLFEAFSGLTFFIDEDAEKKDDERRAPALTDLMVIDAVS